MPPVCGITRRVLTKRIPLREVQVRLVRRGEVPRWTELMRRHHYLGFRKMCGRRLHHVAVWRGRWLALLGWHAAALHCAARDRWIGWSSLQRRARLFLVAGNTRFLILPEASGQPCLASRVLGLSLRRLPRDWQKLHGHSVLLAESFVDPALYAGTCYRAANWIEVGTTRGFGRVRGTLNYARHGRPKTVFVRPLRRGARRQLRAAQPRPEWQPWRPRMKLGDSQLASLREALEAVPDCRGRRGLRYPLPTVLTIVLASRLAGCQTLTETSDFGRGLSQDALRRIGSRLRPQTQRYHAPGISTLHYVLKDIDIDRIESVLADWMKEQLPGTEAVAIDGKTLRGSCNHDRGDDGQPRQEAPQQQLSAVDIDSRTVVGQIGYSGSKDEAEGAALRAILPTLDPGTIVLADALHTARETARQIGDPGLSCILQVKGSQPLLLEQLDEYKGRGGEVRTVDGEHGRIETRVLERTDEIARDVPVPWLDFPGARFAARITRAAMFTKDGRERQPEVSYIITSLPPEKAAPETLPPLSRGYWGAVENGIHYVRDAALREDACRVRSSALPRLMAAFANLAISILRLLQVRNIKRAMKQLLFAGGATAVLSQLLP